MINKDEAQEFHDFEYKGWQTAALKYSRFSLLTSQSVKPLLNNLDLKEDDKLLDVACGPGFLTEEAHNRKCNVFIGIDSSEEMINTAKLNYPDINFEVLNAENTEFKNNTFSKIASNHGLIHFARPEVVLKEMNRIAQKEAKIGITLWDDIDRAIAFSIVSQVVSKLSTVKVQAPKGLGMGYFTNEDNAKKLFLDSGWTLTDFIHLPIVWELETPESIIDILMEGTVLMASRLKNQPKDILEKIKDEVIKQLKQYTDKNNKVRVPQGVLLLIGKK